MKSDLKNNKTKASDLKKERTRAKLISTAREVFAHNGFKDTNISDIAKKSGVAHGTVYYHFPDKKTLLLEVMNEFFGQAAGIAQVWSQTRDASEEFTNRQAMNLASFLYRNRDIARILRNETYNTDKDIRGAIDGFFENIRSQAAQALEIGMDMGVVRPLDPQITAVAHIGMLKEVIYSLIDDPNEHDISQVINEIVTLQDYGIRPRDGNSPGAE